MQSKQLLLPNQTWDVLCMNVSKMYDQWLLPISLQLSYGQQETRRALRGVHLDNLTQCDVPHFQYTYDRTMKPRRQSPSVLRPSNAVFSNTCLAVSKRLKQTIELCTYTCRNKKKNVLNQMQPKQQNLLVMGEVFVETIEQHHLFSLRRHLHTYGNHQGSSGNIRKYEATIYP